MFYKIFIFSILLIFHVCLSQSEYYSQYDDDDDEDVLPKKIEEPRMPTPIGQNPDKDDYPFIQRETEPPLIPSFAYHYENDEEKIQVYTDGNGTMDNDYDREIEDILMQNQKPIPRMFTDFDKSQEEEDKEEEEYDQQRITTEAVPPLITTVAYQYDNDVEKIQIHNETIEVNESKIKAPLMPKQEKESLIPADIYKTKDNHHHHHHCQEYLFDKDFKTGFLHVCKDSHAEHNPLEDIFKNFHNYQPSKGHKSKHSGRYQRLACGPEPRLKTEQSVDAQIKMSTCHIQTEIQDIGLTLNIIEKQIDALSRNCKKKCSNEKLIKKLENINRELKRQLETTIENDELNYSYHFSE